MAAAAAATAAPSERRRGSRMLRVSWALTLLGLTLAPCCHAGLTHMTHLPHFISYGGASSFEHSERQQPPPQEEEQQRQEKGGDVRARVLHAVDLIHKYGGQDTHLKVANVPVRYPYPLFLCENCGRECDLCGMITKTRLFAPVETALFDFILKRGCASPLQGSSGTPRLVVDVGANIGYFALLAANYGCRVQAFEPQDLNRALLLSSLALNQLEGLVDLHSVALGDTPGSARLQGFGAFATLEPNGTDAKARHLGLDRARTQDVDVHTLSEYVPPGEDVLLLKIDTEGYEGRIVGGALPLLESVTVHNVLIEVKYFRTPEKLQMLQQLMKTAGLPYAYTYKEEYKISYPDVYAVNLHGRMVDVSDMLMMGDSSDHELDALHEDFLLRREPLPGRFVSYVRAPYGHPWQWAVALVLMAVPVGAFCVWAAGWGRERMLQRQLRRQHLRQFRTAQD